MNGFWYFTSNGIRFAEEGGDMPEPEPELPEIPAECHNTRPIDPETCMAAVRAMCGEGK